MITGAQIREAAFDSLSVDPPLYACVHEAGHAVTAHKHGLPIPWVSVIPISFDRARLR